MKNITNILYIALLTLSCWGCKDFFETNPDDIINNDDYISQQSEMYTGYYGIINKMQEMADHAIYLTDVRADNLEITSTSAQELQALYNYEPTEGNSYADPACYYTLIISCNDYLNKMAGFYNEKRHTLDETALANWKSLVSSAIRVKAWTYLRIAQIYGKAYWFSDPMVEIQDMKNSGFLFCNNPKDIAANALELLDAGETKIRGLEGIDGSLTMDWASYHNPEDPNASAVKYWDYVTPDWLLLRCEILLWTGNPDYDWIRDQILTKLQTVFNASTTQYRLNANVTNNYYKIFTESANSDESVCSVIYNYLRKQTHRLTAHFSDVAPNLLNLRPSAYGSNCYSKDDKRLTVNCTKDSLNVKYIYNSARKKYQSDNTILLQRGHDYHFYLAEAENALGNWKQSSAILNTGVAAYFKDATTLETEGEWDVRYSPWLRYGTNYNMGICGCVNASVHSYGAVLENGKIVLCLKAAGIGENVDYLVIGSPSESIALAAEKAIADLKRDRIPYSIGEDDNRIYLQDESARQKYFDLQLLDEMLLEYAAEGRAYGMMIRMAIKYNDYDIIANRVSPKYPESLQDKVRARILAGHYFIDWNI